VRDKKERHRMVCERALEAFDTWWSALELKGLVGRNSLRAGV